MPPHFAGRVVSTAISYHYASDIEKAEARRDYNVSVGQRLPTTKKSKNFEDKTVILSGKKQLTCTYAHVSTFFVFSPLKSN